LGTSADFDIDVSESVGSTTPTHLRVTVHCPADADAVRDHATVCFAFPGAGYGRRYFSLVMPGDEGGQAAFHTARGWIFIECDHLGVGDSTVPPEDEQTLPRAVAANGSMVEQLVARLHTGDLVPELGPLTQLTTLGIGQSMGGMLTLALQGQTGIFDGVASLGYSAVQTKLPEPPDITLRMPWLLRAAPDGSPIVTNGVSLTDMSGPEEMLAVMTYAFHDYTEPADIVTLDMAGDENGLPAWRSKTVPPFAILGVAPGVVATEAASITVPVLIALGERDVSTVPYMEPFAYRSCRDISLYICPEMAHMHNFSRRRRAFWDGIQTWGDGVHSQSRYEY
jgi:pimeloyl-ACP methyl ester carboxylesterase